MQKFLIFYLIIATLIPYDHKWTDENYPYKSFLNVNRGRPLAFTLRKLCHPCPKTLLVDHDKAFFLVYNVYLPFKIVETL